MIQPSVRNKWEKLETVVLGTCHLPEFFNKLPYDNIREPLKRIAEQTLEDLEGFENILKQFGVQVLRCQTEHQDITEYQGHIPRNALQPRDGQLVIGNKLVFTRQDNPGIEKLLKETVNSDNFIIHPAYESDVYFDAPNVTVVDDLITVEIKNQKKEWVQWFKQNLPQYTIKPVAIGGHSDGTFHTIKQGAILSVYDVGNYKDTFPEWDICYVEENGWNNETEWFQMKDKTQNKWYVEGEGANDDFIKYVNTWLDKWVGYVEETVFDVNVLVLDEHHVCVSNPNNQKVNDFLKKHRMEPIYVPWRHRFFWDGGLHCITLDLVRANETA